MIRTVLTAVTVVVATIIIGSLAILFGIFNPYSKCIYIFSQLWARSILYISGAKIKVHGLENIDINKNYIFVGNHQSHFDVLAVFRVLPMSFLNQN